MKNKISVFLNQDNNPAPFMQAIKVNIYNKNTKWELCKVIDLNNSYAQDIKTVRHQIQDIADMLEDTGIIAVKEILGVAYSVFDKAGFDIFSISEYNDQVFDEILNDVEKNKLQKQTVISTVPVETSVPGIYFLDLIALQTEHPMISSKKALQEFLGFTPFLELRLICNHIPPWLENGAYDIREQKTKNGITAIITKKQCR